jgi:hypothetical protein
MLTPKSQAEQLETALKKHFVPLGFENPEEEFDLEDIESSIEDPIRTIDNLRTLYAKNKLKAAQLELLANEAMAQAFKAHWYEKYLKKIGKKEVISECNESLLGIKKPIN